MTNKTSFVPVLMDNQSIIRIEATILDGTDIKRRDEEEDIAFDNDGEEDVAFGVLDFSEVTNAIEGIATYMSSMLKKIEPKKATVEFGIEVGLESGKLTAMVVKGSGKANIKITLEW